MGDVGGASYANEDDVEVNGSPELSVWLSVRCVVSRHAQAAPWATSRRGAPARKCDCAQLQCERPLNKFLRSVTARNSSVNAL